MISKLFKNTYFLLVFTLFFCLISCGQSKAPISDPDSPLEIVTGAQQTAIYLKYLQNKNVAIVANQTSVITKGEGQFIHVVDSLLKLNIQIKKVFSPEHGFGGKADAGEIVKDGIDSKSGLPIISLHGKSKKPTAEQLQGIDAIIFDLQDVGVRFYTKLSTLHYVMEACAEAGIPLLLFDRPNPNAHYIDGPTLKMEHKSFVGMHPIPLVYGMTIGEYAQMVNGEGWLKNEITCDITVIPLKNYNHNSNYSLAIRPSPNLPNDKAINLYPSLGFFEGTTINAGRGTENQFQQYGAPFFPNSEYTYMPQPNFGSKSPKHKGILCNGVNLKQTSKLKSVNFEWIIDAYNKTPDTIRFFGPTFTVHAGNIELEAQIKAGLSAKEISDSWQPQVEAFKKIRKKYLIYD